MSRDCCETCRFWHDYGGASRNGECRRGPPVVFFSQDPDRESPTLFPITSASIWCGEHGLRSDLEALQGSPGEATATGRRLYRMGDRMVPLDSPPVTPKYGGKP